VICQKSVVELFDIVCGVNKQEEIMALHGKNQAGVEISTQREVTFITIQTLPQMLLDPTFILSLSWHSLVSENFVSYARTVLTVCCEQNIITHAVLCQSYVDLRDFRKRVQWFDASVTSWNSWHGPWGREKRPRERKMWTVANKRDFYSRFTCRSRYFRLLVVHHSRNPEILLR